jgi:uncharacterized membrane protein
VDVPRRVLADGKHTVASFYGVLETFSVFLVVVLVVVMVMLRVQAMVKVRGQDSRMGQQFDAKSDWRRRRSRDSRKTGC